MSDSNYIKVFSGTFIIVQLVMDRLKSAGINAIIKDEAGLGEHSGFTVSNTGYQEIYVSQEELNDAVRIVAAVNADLNP